MSLHKYKKKKQLLKENARDNPLRKKYAILFKNVHFSQYFCK